MLIEAARCKELSVVDAQQNRLGNVDFLIFDGDKGALVGMQVIKKGVIKKFYGILYQDVDLASLDSVVVDQPNSLQEDLKDFDLLYKKFGPVVGVKAVTQSGKRIGKVADLFIDNETGLVIRFVIRDFVMERIIPRQFVVSITPQAIVFNDAVNEPTFDKLASGELVTSPTKS